MKKLLFLLLVILSVSAFGQGMRCPQCPPSPVGHAGEVLGTDGTFLEWVPSGGGGSGDTTFAWSTHGNTGTNSSVNSIGTLDAVSFITKTNGTKRIAVDTAGNTTVGKYDRVTTLGAGVNSFHPLFEVIDSVNRSSNVLNVQKFEGTAARCGFYAAFNGSGADSASYGGMGVISSLFTDTNFADRFLIQAGGHVKGTTLYTDAGDLIIGVGASNNYPGTFTNINAPNIYISRITNVSGVVQTIPQPGTVGVGTSLPTGQLHVAGGTLNISAASMKRAMTVSGNIFGTDAGQDAVLFDITSHNSGNFSSRALRVDLNATTNTNTNTGAIWGFNKAAGTGSDLRWTTSDAVPLGNAAVMGLADANTSGFNCGGWFEAALGTTSVGVFGKSATVKNSGTNVGVIGQAINTGSSPIHIGGFFYTDDATPTLKSATILANNGATAMPIMILQDGGTDVVTIADGGATTFTSSVSTTNLIAGNKSINTTAGDAATINAMAGRFRKDASGTTFTLTNSFVTANSIVILDQANAAFDATATSWTKICSANTITIEFNAAPTGNFDMDFLVIN